MYKLEDVFLKVSSIRKLQNSMNMPEHIAKLAPYQLGVGDFSSIQINLLN